jgi:hypothetical protein
MHEQRAREAAGLPEPPPRLPDFVPYNEHEAVLRDLAKARQALKAISGGAIPEDLVDASALEQARSEIEQLRAAIAAAGSNVDASAVNAEVERLTGEVEALEDEFGAALQALAGEIGMAEIRNVRRFYLHKRLTGEEETRPVWQAKQEAEPGTALAEDFPCRSELAALGYTTEEDLDGADQDELVRAGLKTNQAKKVIAAL